MAITQMITLHADRKLPVPYVDVVQYDTGRIIKCILADYTIPSGATAKLWCMRPSGTKFSYNGTIESASNSASFALTDEDGALTRVGNVAAQVVITSSGTVVSTFDFIIRVVKSLIDTPTPEEVTTFEQLLEELREQETKIDEMTIDATVDNTTGTPTVEVDKEFVDDHYEFTFDFKHLKGSKGDKGDTGDTGAQGPQGEPGNSGVYVGSGDMPEDCNVQIDPDGAVTEVVQTIGESTTNVMSQKAVTDLFYPQMSWERLGNIIASGESPNYIEAGDTVDINWIKTVTGSTSGNHTVTCSDMQKFIDKVDECESKTYMFVFDGTNWIFNEQIAVLSDYGLSVSGTPASGEVMTIVTVADPVNFTFVGYDNFEPTNAGVEHNWCLEQTYAPNTKAYDTYESVFNLAKGKTLPAGNYKIRAPYYTGSPLLDIYITVPSDVTATDDIVQFASQGYQNVPAIPGSTTNYYIPSAVRPAYFGTTTYLTSSITVLYNQTGTWTDISTVDGVSITSAFAQSALGNNCPAYSNLRQWLNDDSISGNYEPTHEFDRPSSYNLSKGFLYGLDPRVRRLIASAKTKFEAGYDNGEYTHGQTYTISDEVFLLSMKEMSFNIQTGEGSATDLYSEYCGGVLTNNAVAERAKYNKAGGSVNSYRWSRSATSSYATNAWGVTSSGSHDSGGAVGAHYVAPAFIIGKSIR